MSRRRRARASPATSVVPRASADEPAAAGDPARSSQRVAAIDVLRGSAIIAMIVYHFAFDLRYFGITRSDFEHSLAWLTARALILSSFLLLAGVSLVLADRRGASSRHFWLHVAKIAACAAIVSAASYALFPRTFIWFGVLHAIAVSLVLARPVVREPRWALAIGFAVVAAGLIVSNPAFDSRALGWLGFMTAKPPTEDYVPLFPWSGFVFIGIALAHALVRTDFRALASFEHGPYTLAWLGRHSLIVYMLHQPLMIGALWLATHR